MSSDPFAHGARGARGSVTTSWSAEPVVRYGRLDPRASADAARAAEADCQSAWHTQRDQPTDACPDCGAGAPA